MADWFYQPPAKVMPRTEPLMLPPTSQIPGLSELPDEALGPAEQYKKMMIKDTDSPYIRLAKQGGRSDLLRQRTPKPAPTEAKGYPRVDWFYQDDIAMEESEKVQPPSVPYESLLPEYMVHQEYTGNIPPGQQGAYEAAPPAEPQVPKRLPYAENTVSVHQAEGRSATDKTRRIEELRKPGYGVRMEKMKGKPPAHLPPMVPSRGQARQGELDENLPSYNNTMPPPLEYDRPVMSKLLAYGYQKDWLEDHEKWEQAHGGAPAHHPVSDQAVAQQQQESAFRQTSGAGTRTRSGQYRRSAQQQVTTNQIFGSRQPSAGSRTGSVHKRRKAEDQGRPDFFNLTPSESRSGMYYRKTQEQSQLGSAGKHDLQPYCKLGPISAGQRERQAVPPVAQ